MKKYFKKTTTDVTSSDQTEHMETDTNNIEKSSCDKEVYMYKHHGQNVELQYDNDDLFSAHLWGAHCPSSNKSSIILCPP